MVPKKLQKTAENVFFVELPGGFEMLPEELLAEIGDFSERNSLIQIATRIKDKKPVCTCCEKCLHAHIMKKAEDYGIEGGALVLLNTKLEFKMGHNGYYMDGGELVKI
jgi:hypothetical protein